MTKLAILMMGLLLLSCCINQPSSEPQNITLTSKREIISLDGEWELLKVKGDLSLTQTGAKAWEKVHVPHYLHAGEDLHSAWYRRTFSGVKAPKVVLAFDSVNFKCVIYVNDQFAGEHTGGYLPFDIDITEHVQEANELLVGVEDVTAVSREKIVPDLLEGTPDNIACPVGSGFQIFGIWQSVHLKTYPSAYIEDVFVKTSCRKKEIELELTIINNDSTKKNIKIKNEVSNDIEFPETEISLDASEAKEVILTKEWLTPILWSPENPHLYNLRTSLTENGTVIDHLETTFGFREFWIENGKFLLNGTPITLRGSSKHLLGDPWTGNHQKDAQETLKRVLAVNSNALRLHANPYPEVFLDTADKMGVLIIDESALWCLSNQYDLESDTFWDNAQEHIETLVRRDRNHPSLVIWSVENEILLCGGYNEERCESEVVHLGDIITQLDPTRPIMYEGDYDLPNADIINVHYPHEYPEWTVFPNEAYFLDDPVVIDSYPRKEFLWDRKKPLYIGEFLWIPPFSPYAHTIFYGDETFTDLELYRKKAKADAWKMYIEAFRSQEVNGFCPWNVLEGGEYPTPLSETVKDVFEPFFGFVKEYTDRFFSGQNIERTVIVCNDTSEEKEVSLTWSSGEQSGEHDMTLNPAEHAEVKIEFTAPHVDKRESFEFTVSMLYDSEVFKIRKVYEVFPREKITFRGKIALYDPVGETRKILDENQINCELIDTLDTASEYDLLIIGYHCIKETEIPTVGEYSDLVGNVLCFEQETLLPFGLSLTDHDSTIAFERAQGFDLEEENLRFWQTDHLVSRRDIAKPVSGNYVPLVDSGGVGGLEYTSLLEYQHPDGKMLFCQLLLTEKYKTEPMAALLFEKVLAYAITEHRSFGTLGAIRHSDMLDSIDAVYEEAEDFTSDVLFVNDDANPGELQSFVFEGGVAWLHGLEPGQVQSIVDADLRFDVMEYEDLPVSVLEDELTRGLCNQEFFWIGERQGWWVPLLHVAEYYISDTGTGTPLTDPCILLKINYGRGFFIVDMLQWEYNQVTSARIVSGLLTNLGIPIRKPSLTIQAETMKIEEVYLGERGGQYYAFYTEGYLGTQVDFLESGTYTLRVYARADVVNDEGALVEIYVDRALVGTVEVTDPGVYEVEIYIEKGIHEIGIAFANDYWNPPEDRNLYVDKIEISSRENDRTFCMC